MHISNNQPSTINKSIIADRNADRRKTFSDLYTACRDNDEKVITRKTMTLSILAYKPEDHGFSVHDLYHYREPIVNMLHGIDDQFHHSQHGLYETLAYKKAQLQKLNKKLSESNGAGNDQKSQDFRKKLSEDIHNISGKIKFLSRIETILNDELRKRGEVIEVMESEIVTGSHVPVMTR